MCNERKSNFPVYDNVRSSDTREQYEMFESEKGHKQMQGKLRVFFETHKKELCK